MYLRETNRRNKDGSTVRYLQLAHNYRDPETGVSKPQIIHNFGRAEHVDKDGLRRLIRSIARELDPADEAVALAGDDVEAVEARDFGGAWVLDRLWRRLGIDKAIRQVADGRRVDADKVERVLFGLVAGRALAPSSKLEACRWITDEVHIDGLGEVDTDRCYRAMDFLLDSLDDLQQTIFFSVADLLQLDVDVLFFDTTSTYFEIELPDDLNHEEEDGDDGDDQDPFRVHGHSKDHRADRPQIVVGMAVTRGGIPVRLWVWPGDTSDQTVVEEVKADLAGWRLNRLVWVFDSGFNSADNRQVWQRGGSGYIAAERLRSREHEVVEARSRQGRYRKVDEHLEVKEITVGQGVGGERFIMCRNSEVAARDAAIRERLVGLLEERIAGSDELSKTRRAELRGRLREKPGLNRYLRVTKSGLLRVDRSKIVEEAKLDGKFLLRTSDPSIPAEDVAHGYKALADVERGFRDLKQLDLRPIHHRLRHRIIAHVQLCWLALLLIRVVETDVGDTWRNVSHVLDRIQLVTLATSEGTVSQTTMLRRPQREVLTALDLDEPPRYVEFTPTT
jgi:transposase